jgi:hypothetical protein
MFALVTFPWPVPSANVPLIAMGSRPVRQPPQPRRSAVTTGSLTSPCQDGPASHTAQRRSLVAPKA